ncbi:MAG: hypothetical protein ACNFW9_05760 [Candidatus Kerfeldbacteria bacterium]
MKNQKGYVRWVVVILISVMAVGLVGATWYYEENREEANTPTTTTTTNTNTVTNTSLNLNTNTTANANITTNLNTEINTNTTPITTNTNATSETNIFSIEATEASYQLSCSRQPGELTNQYLWYQTFSDQIIEGWGLDIVCFNEELNKTIYLKSQKDSPYRYDPDKDSYGTSQLGIYNISENTFTKAEEHSLSFYEGCSTIKNWSTTNVITYMCAAGDAGVGTVWTHLYDITSGGTTLSESCSIETDEGCIESLR